MSSRSSAFVPGVSGNVFNQPAGAPQFLPAASYLPAALTAAQPSVKWPVPGGSSPRISGFGPCFQCGMVGHLKNACPRLYAARAAGTTKVTQSNMLCCCLSVLDPWTLIVYVMIVQLFIILWLPCVNVSTVFGMHMHTCMADINFIL